MSARRFVLPDFPDLVDKLDNRWLQMPTHHAERLRNGAGDLALRWEVARALALRTPQYVILSSVVAALKTHPILVIQRFPIGGDLVNPRCLCSSCYRCFSTQEWLSPLINLKALRADSAQPAKNSVSMTDEKPTLASVGLTGQVASCRPYPPPLAMKSSRDLDGSRAVYPISRTSIDRWAAFLPYALYKTMSSVTQLFLASMRDA
jgi:hypothetical protein